MLHQFGTRRKDLKMFYKVFFVRKTSRLVKSVEISLKRNYSRRITVSSLKKNAITGKVLFFGILMTIVSLIFIAKAIRFSCQHHTRY